ncbi:MAG: hypothetical protein NVSMB56_12980 [Pyrinomonadaceae bacterium]
MPNKSGIVNKTAKNTAQVSNKRRKASSAKHRTQDRFGASVGLLEAIETLTEPFARSLESLLRLAVDEIGAAEASVLVRDEESKHGGLKFLVATGEAASTLKKIRVPHGKGIAGFVYASGQPIAVADAQSEASFYSDVDRVTGFSTQIILATPLHQNDETVGVLEFINRNIAPPYAAFTPDEMDAAARYAEPVAALVAARDIVAQSVKLFAHANEENSSGKDDIEWLETLRAAPEHREMLALAVLLRDIASRGVAEQKMCREILESLARWANEKSLY